jgi:hypothetical protein
VPASIGELAQPYRRVREHISVSPKVMARVAGGMLDG